jgi:membrane protein YqaA with SNARE-associated domain
MPPRPARQKACCNAGWARPFPYIGVRRASEVNVGGLSRWLFGFFLSTWGITILAALDSSILFSVPFAIDAAVVILAAQHRDLFWLYPLIVVPSSLLGAATTYWIGWKIGEEGLQLFVPRQRLKRIHDRVRSSGAFALPALDLIPPPFPFTPIILVSGALEVAPRRFFLTLAAVRVVRFGAEAVLALFYGDVIMLWLESETVRTIAGILFVLVLAGAAISSYRLVRSTARRGRPRSVRA